MFIGVSTTNKPMREPHINTVIELDSPQVTELLKFCRKQRALRATSGISLARSEWECGAGATRCDAQDSFRIRGAYLENDGVEGGASSHLERKTETPGL